MDDVKKDDAVPAAAKSIDPAALEMLAYADECGIETAFSRADRAGLHGVGAAEGRLDAALVGVRQHLERRRVDAFGGGRYGVVLLHVIHWSSPWAGAGARRAGAGCARRPKEMTNG